jgi:tRNA(fMet)-specific endonuclease VapC
MRRHRVPGSTSVPLYVSAINYSKIPVIGFDEATALTAAMFKKSELRLGTMDIRIAATALAHDALLLSRNLRDFRRVPSLRVDDWTAP